MSRSTYLRLLAASFISALILSLISVLFLNRIADGIGGRHRDRFFVFLAEVLERKLATLSPEEIRTKENLFRPDWFQNEGDNHLRPPPPGGRPPMPPPHFPPPPDFPPPSHFPPPPQNGFFTRPGEMFPPPPPSGDRHGPPGPELWLVTENGDILNTSSAFPLPASWPSLPKPTEVHGLALKEDFFRIFPSVTVVKLDHTPALYLVAYDNKKQALMTLFGAQALFTFSTVLIALILSTSFIFIYLRRKSDEARRVLLSLERGDLKARFPIQRFDESGGLLVDFNRMAEEIEKLVNRVHSTESTRKNLLQELGHDLKTPLTSLTTSLETLKVHLDKMKPEDRQDVFEMIEADVKYIRELLDQLMTISALDEPNYKASTETIDLLDLLNEELKTRQAATSLHWHFFVSGSVGARALILGDGHLIQRMVKNGLDNAARFAKTRIAMDLSEHASMFEIVISDDGPGLSEQDLALFGKRRGQRTKRKGEGLHFSLGLGSVIMKSIAELHGGSVKMENGVQGARLVIHLPKSILS